MRTLYYLTDTLDTVEGMAGTLRNLNVDDDGYYVVSHDRDGLRRRHLHDASLMDETDIVHSGEQGALIGGFCGLLFAFWVAVMQPMGLTMTPFSFLFVSILIGFFGAWVGGMVGISHENYKLTPFHGAIVAGKYLMVVMVRTPAKAREVKQVMHRRHPEAVFEAEDSIGVDALAGKAEFRPRHL
jgi:hypothetical protein